jgi:hypothetical protein
MEKMKRHIFILSLLLIVFHLNAQEALSEVKKLAYGNPFNSGNENFINMTNALADDQQFSLMMFDDWKPLEINGAESELVIIDSANYHMEADKILFVRKGMMYELFPEKIKHALIDEHKFVSLTYAAEKKTLKRAYFQVLVEGSYTLLSKQELVKEISNSSPLGLAATREVHYVLHETLFYYTESRTRPVPVPKKKADFIKIFRRDREELAAYAKSNKYSLKRTEDVKAIFSYYNSLEQ